MDYCALIGSLGEGFEFLPGVGLVCEGLYSVSMRC